MNFNNLVLPSELYAWIQNNNDFQLIDITENHLLGNSKVNHNWIPAFEIMERINEISTLLPVVICCRVGADSFTVMNLLLKQFGFTNIYSLKSGFEGYIEFVNGKES
ncbi:MAG: hypothetical protein U0W24_14895 [Bacteroidales bacterium]